MSVSPWLHASFPRRVVFARFAGAAVRKQYRLEGLHNRNVFLTALAGRSQNQSVNRGGFFWGWSGKACSRPFSFACWWLSYPLSLHIVFSVWFQISLFIRTPIIIRAHPDDFNLIASLKALGLPGGSAVKNLPVMQETQVQSLDWKDLLEEGMATPSGILAWRVLWTEKPDWLQSVGSQRVRHNWNDWACRHEGLIFNKVTFWSAGVGTQMREFGGGTQSNL